MAMTEHLPSLLLTDPTVLVTLTGPDKSGVSTQLFASLAEFDIEVIDIEQLVLRGRLVLGVLLSVAEDTEAFEAAVHAVGSRTGLDVALEYGVGDNRARRVGRTQVTVLGTPLRPGAVAAMAGKIRAAGGNIDRIHRLARYPVTAIKMEISGAEPDLLRVDLATEAAAQGIDVAVQPHGILRHAQRLIVMDVDSTLIQGEVIEMIAARAGCEQQVAEVTAAAMRGELEFGSSLESRVGLLRGVDVAELDEIYSTLVYTPGARTMIRTLKRLGYKFALVSGGFTQIIEQIAAALEIDYFAANELEVVDGALTGSIVGPVVDRAGKADALRRFAAESGISVKNTVAIGDGANDIDMLAAAGLGIAFNAKPVVRTKADTSLNVPYLDAIIYLLGISREEVEAADAADQLLPPA